MNIDTRASPIPDLSAEVEALVIPLAKELNHALLRVYAYLRPPYSLGEDETYRVDLARRSLSVIYGGQPAYEASVQVLGTYCRDDRTWLWPRADSSIRPDAFQALASKLVGIEACRLMLEHERFIVREDLGFALAAWLARECGCIGVYPALADEGIHVFLAIETLDGLPGFALRDISCSFCYRAREACERIVTVGEHLGVCSGCVRDFEEIALMDFPGDDLATVATRMRSDDAVPDTHPTTPCVACAGYGRRIFGAEASLCYECLAICSAAILRS